MKYTYLVSGLVLIMACGQAPRPSFAGFEQMEGSWVCKQANGQVFSETWTIKGDRMYGQGCQLQGSDTLFGEKLVVEQLHGKLVYIALVPGQDPVVFTRQPTEDQKAFLFENSEHDFPQVLVYSPSSNSTLRVSVSGKEKDSTVTEEMIFNRQQP